VGFIRDLPHKLVEAFEATLQEAADANLLLHVVDASTPFIADQMAEVQRVLADIGAADIQQVLVYNKFDKLEDTQRPRTAVDVLEVDGGVRVPRVFVSALTGQGIDALKQIISQAIDGTLAERLSLISAASASSNDGEHVHDDVAGVDVEADLRPTGTQHSHS
jgi:GTP-binding protein HflX